MAWEHAHICLLQLAPSITPATVCTSTAFYLRLICSSLLRPSSQSRSVPTDCNVAEVIDRIEVQVREVWVGVCQHRQLNHYNLDTSACLLKASYLLIGGLNEKVQDGYFNMLHAG
ncbi:putative glucan endo-1,3-beta-glucosidase btgC [Clarias magur]|uniref:Putative glucan endo-1,3-beta-glucosidase btgC n=1 Tax=Clarias magur TaxID=1594786 RepID=A0A8J4WZ90_CLAMG|nr:putative glucan endo-1,3-beta-glucosidase btgC [Clarias magur]